MQAQNATFARRALASVEALRGARAACAFAGCDAIEVDADALLAPLGASDVPEGGEDAARDARYAAALEGCDAAAVAAAAADAVDATRVRAAFGPPRGASLEGIRTSDLFVVGGWGAPPADGLLGDYYRSQWHILREDAGAYAAGVAAGELARHLAGEARAVAGVVTVGLAVGDGFGGVAGGEASSARVLRHVNGFVGGAQAQCARCVVYDLGAVGRADAVAGELLSSDRTAASAPYGASLVGLLASRAGLAGQLPAVVYVIGGGELHARACEALMLAGALVISGLSDPLLDAQPGDYLHELLDPEKYVPPAPPPSPPCDVDASAQAGGNSSVMCEQTEEGDPEGGASTPAEQPAPPSEAVRDRDTNATDAAATYLSLEDVDVAHARLVGNVYARIGLGVQLAVQAGAALPAGVRTWGIEADAVAAELHIDRLERLAELTNDTIFEYSPKDDDSSIGAYEYEEGEGERFDATSVAIASARAAFEGAVAGLIAATVSTGVDVQTGESLAERNRPPIWIATPVAELSVREGDEADLLYEAYDPDEDAVLYAAVSETLPPSSTLNGVTGVLRCGQHARVRALRQCLLLPARVGARAHRTSRQARASCRFHR